MEILSGEHSMRWLFLSIVSRSNFNLECWYFARGGKPGVRTPRKTFRTRKRTENTFNLLVTPGPGIEPRPQRWEDSALISAPFPVLLRPGRLTDYSSNAELAINLNYQDISINLPGDQYIYLQRKRNTVLFSMECE